MEARTTLKALIIIMTLVVMLLIIAEVPRHAIAENSRSVVATELRSNVGLPVQITIPAIGVNAKVESLGLTQSGTIDVPKGPIDAAWYNLGTRPGEVGSSVIVGHMGWNGRTPAVFDKLIDIRVGDRVYVKDDHDRIIVFVVIRTKVYEKDADTSEVVDSKDRRVHLNLITCGGDWNMVTRTYSDRLVVFADGVEK